MTSTIRSILIWMTIVTLMLIWLPFLAVMRLFNRDPVRYATGYWFRRLGKTMTGVNPAWRVRVSGVTVEDPRNPYVVVCNHQSQADIPVISCLPWEMKWVGKAELFKIPVVGWMMRMAGDIAVDRDVTVSRGKALVKARQYLRQRCSVIFFPEGTRSPDGKVHDFSEGVFRLAIKEKVPVLPLVVDGTFAALPKDDWRFGPPTAIQLRVLPPVETAGLKAGDAEALCGRVRNMIIQQLAEWRGIAAGDVDATRKDSVNTDSPSD